MQEPVLLTDLRKGTSVTKKLDTTTSSLILNQVSTILIKI